VIRRLRHTIFIRTYAPNLGRLEHATTLCLQVIENDGGPGQSRTADLRFRKALVEYHVQTRMNTDDVKIA
jgi:hypothetical protein